MLEFTGEGPASDFYHEAVQRVWFVHSLGPKEQAGLGPSALTLTGSPEGDAEAFELLQSEALEGGVHAIHQLALLTILGCGTEADVDAGLFLLEEAAGSGLADAQTTLGRLFADGMHVEPDLARALDWLTEAAEQDHAEAKPHLDRVIQALADLRLGADQGHADAQYRMGVMALGGRGLLRDEVRGRAWLVAAAAQGHQLAKERLHVLDDILPALRTSAEAGDAAAQFEYARYLMRDEEIPQDLPQAIHWLKRAAQQGHDEATRFLGLGTAWQNGDLLLSDLRAAAAKGEAWAIAALAHVPPGVED